jgi:hypothetical protein
MWSVPPAKTPLTCPCVDAGDPCPFGYTTPELRHRRRARAEDRIRAAKATGLTTATLYEVAPPQRLPAAIGSADRAIGAGARPDWIAMFAPLSI